MDEIKKPVSGSFSKLMSSPPPAKPAEEKETPPQAEINAHTKEPASKQDSMEQELRELKDSSGVGSSNQSADQSISKSTNLSTRQVMRRPTAFYLYEDQSEELDDLVSLMRKKYKIKTDRSGLLRAILTRPVLDFHDDSNYEKLVERLLSQATSRLIGR
jgi:hypothetical protein